MEFSKEDIEYAHKKGINAETLQHQLELLQRGNSFPILVRPARLNDGITAFSEQQEEKLVELFHEFSQFYDWCRFIPASGAASRMFAFLVNYLEDEKSSPEIELFFESILSFPFYEKVKKDIEGKNRKEIIELLLSERGVNFTNLPKGLIKFHTRNETSFTAVASQLAESEKYSFLKNKVANSHFTISEEHFNYFEEETKLCCNNSDVNHNIQFSYQKESTDTISLDEDGNLCRDENNNLVFRPGGHGSLLKNLNELDEDFIFIRNIDNVVSPYSNEEYVYIHQVMGGLMIKLARILFATQKKIASNEEISDTDLSFLRMYLGFKGEISSVKEFVFRPFRIGGMVKNSGEPGGGPFWVKTENGESLQIVESAQVNVSDAAQVDVFNNSTHFNPVDLCCLIKNYRGEKYNLAEFSNENLSFVSEKMVNGKKIKILEHPGLWNGSMDNWLTVFIEIPSSVFNPVKTINDLLRPAHQK